MTEPFDFQTFKLVLIGATGLSKDALHVYFGMGVLIGTALLLGKSLRSALPWLLVLLVAVAGEALDAGFDLTSHGTWAWRASVHDLVNTLFWPTVLLLIARRRTAFAA